MPFAAVPSPPALFPTYLVPSLPFRRRKSSTDSTLTAALRSNSIDSAGSAGDSAGSSTGDAPATFLSGHGSRLRCGRCAADLAHSSQIISKGFTGRHGRAYLVAADIEGDPEAIAALEAANTTRGAKAIAAARNAALPNLPNTHVHKPVPRTLVTGAHTVGDISCAHCGSALGWKYVGAEEEAQKYKIGKFILEARRVCRSSAWEGEDGVFDDEDDDDDGEEFGVAERRRRRRRRRASSFFAMPPSEHPRIPAAVAEAGEDIEFDSQDEDEREDLFLGVWTPALAAKRRKQKRFERVNEH